MTARTALHMVRGMKNSLAAVLIVALLATSVLIILDFLALQTGGEALIAAGPGVATRADRARIVQSFYDAANADSAGPTSWTLAAVVSPGVGYPGSRTHSPDEHVRLDHFLLASQHMARILDRFAGLDWGP